MAKNYSRKKKPPFRGQKKECEGMEEGKTNSKFPQTRADLNYNDPSWYAKNDQMLKDAASFSYNRPIGSRFPIEELFQTGNWTSNHPITNSFLASDTSRSVPGVMALVTGIGPGLSKDYRSPINLAAQNIYTYVRYNNSGSYNYEPEDLMLYMFALDSAYACWNFLKRLYGIARSYDQTNWYLPKALVEACGVDYSDLMSNLSDFRLFLNTTAARLSSFCVPATMPIFVRHSWMFSNVWADAANQKAQLYEYVPLYFFQYSESSNPRGGELLAKPWSSWTTVNSAHNSSKPILNTVQYCYDYMNSLIDVLYKSEDIGVMSGDILKAYGSGNLFKVSSVEAEYTVLPVYNEEVLNQIHNATVINDSFHSGGTAAGSTSVFNITQDPNSQIIIWDPRFVTGTISKMGTILNMPWNDVTPSNTMVGSRLACTYSVTGNLSADEANPFNAISQFTSVGTEFIWNAYVCVVDFTSLSGDFPYLWTGYKTLLETTGQFGIRTGELAGLQTDWIPFSDLYEYRRQLHGMMKSIVMVSQFDWAPLYFMLEDYLTRTMDNTSTTTKSELLQLCTGTIADMSNWTVIRQLEMENLHLTAVMSEFNIPQIGSF